jgi:NTP pyrophosphatase (non-canonical NTP hydrolase)
MAKIKLDRALLAANWAKEVGPLDKEIGLGSELKRLDDLNDDVDEDLFEVEKLSTRAEIETRMGEIDAALKKPIKAAVDQANAVVKLAKKCQADYRAKEKKSKGDKAAAKEAADIAEEAADVVREAGDYAHLLAADADQAREDLKDLLAKVEKAETENAPTGELSGPKWVAKFATSRTTSALTSAFGRKVDDFIAAIKAAGGTLTVSATFRPLRRAFLMHYSFRIAKQKFDPAKVPPFSGIDIKWVHPTATESIKAATQMVKGYGIVHKPERTSNHTARRAIDMTIRNIIGKTMKNAAGNDVAIKTKEDLHEVGETYGVIKLVKDEPHWSEDGR